MIKDKQNLLNLSRFGKTKFAGSIHTSDIWIGVMENQPMLTFQKTQDTLLIKTFSMLCMEPLVSILFTTVHYHLAEI